MELQVGDKFSIKYKHGSALIDYYDVVEFTVSAKFPFLLNDSTEIRYTFGNRTYGILFQNKDGIVRSTSVMLLDKSMQWHNRDLTGDNEVILYIVPTEISSLLSACTCDINSLMNLGCKCGYIKQERGNHAKA